MANSKRLNVQKFNLGGTPRKVVYHSESRLLLVMRTELTYETCSSDICCVDPISGIVLTSFKLDHGETGKSMELVRVGNEQVLVVGTSLSSGPAIMPSGEAERCNIVPFIFHFYLIHDANGNNFFYLFLLGKCKGPSYIDFLTQLFSEQRKGPSYCFLSSACSKLR